MLRKMLNILWLVSVVLPVYADNLPRDFVYLKDVDPSILQEMRYASSYNFIGRPIQGYLASECILTLPTALALQKVQAELKKSSLSLKVYDCYRPQKAVDDFIAWSTQVNHQEMKAAFYPRVNKADFFKLGYVAEKSGHTRGSTVDLTIVPLSAPHQANYPSQLNQFTSCPNTALRPFPDNSIDMGTGFDCMDELSHYDNASIHSAALADRQKLNSMMRQHGFIPYSNEWWHFTLNNEPYPHTYFNADIRDHSQQLILILMNDWSAMQGRMQRYQRNAQHNWQAIGSSIPVVIGKNGLAHESLKKEGDLRTPTGIFKIQSTFGFAKTPDIKIKLPYIPLTESTYCVDDVNSVYYNHIVDKDNIKKVDWNSGEQMRLVPLYKIGAVVSYNSDNPVRGAGSCIFMHIWRNDHSGTAGCIAMAEPNLQQLLSWLNPVMEPKIAIFTRQQYQQQKSKDYPINDL